MGTLTDQELRTELKNIRLEEDGTFTALFAPFNQVDKAGDVTMPGAFGRQKVVISAYGHGTTTDNRLPIGKGVIYDGHEGGIVEGQFFLNTSAGLDTYNLVKAMGDLQQWSYWLPKVESEPGTWGGKKVRILKKIEVGEVSPVLRGAGNGTRTLSVKNEIREGNMNDVIEKLAAEHEHRLEVKNHHEVLRKFARNGGTFDTVGDFVLKVVDAPAELKAMGIVSGEAGGFAVPTGLSERLYQVDPLQAYIRARAIVIPPGPVPDAEMDIPAARQGANPNVITFSSANEGTAGTANDPKLDLITLAPQRMSANIDVGNSLLRNSSAFTAWFTPAFQAAKAAVEEYMFLRGTGGAQPLGMLNSPGVINVSRGTPSTIVYNDLVNMAAKAYGFPTMIWVCSQTAVGQVLQLKDSLDADADGQLTLMSRPLFWTSRLPTLGTRGDLLLVNPAMYYVKDGSGPFIDASPFTGSNFINDVTTLRCTFYLDGQPALKGTLTLEDGTVCSPVVVLS